ncbi:MAG: GNAT family N-acetyltransferase [Gaiellales bacterium]
MRPFVESPATGRARAGALTTRVARSVDEIESLRSAWWALGTRALPTDIDYFLTVARHHREMERPHVVVVEREGVPVAIAPGYVQQGWIGHRLGPWTPYRPTVRAVTLAYGGLVGEDGEDVAAAVAEALEEALAAGEADAVHLRFTDPDGPLTAELTGRAHALRREHFVPLRPHWGLGIPDSPDEFFTRLSPTTREGLRRTARRLERKFATQMRVEIHHTPDTFTRLVTQVDTVARASYQFEGGTVFSDSPLDVELARLGLERGWFRAYVLSLGAKPVAYWTGFAYGGTFGWRGATGYDPDYRSHSPGTFLLLRLIEDLCHDPGIHRFDLGGGDVEYKRRIADQFWEEVDVRVFGSGPRNVGRALAGSAIGAAHVVTRAVAELVGARRAPTLARRRKLKRQALSRAADG